MGDSYRETFTLWAVKTKVRGVSIGNSLGRRDQESLKYTTRAGGKSARMKTSRGRYTLNRGDWSGLITDFVATVAM